MSDRGNPLTSGPSRAPARAMLKAVGFSDADLKKPLIGDTPAGSNATNDRWAGSVYQGRGGQRAKRGRALRVAVRPVPCRM